MRIGHTRGHEGFGKAGLASGEIEKYIKFTKTDDKLEKLELPARDGAEAQSGDSVEISEDARAAKEGGERKSSKLEDMISRYRRLLEELERSSEQSDAMAESMKERIKCLRIAMRIMSGDKVPKEDVDYLIEKDLDLYAKAIMMKRHKPDPEEHDRISEDEEEEGGSGEAGSKRIEAGSVKPAAASGEAAETQDAVAEADAPAMP